jgi:hypothetical protein
MLFPVAAVIVGIVLSCPVFNLGVVTQISPDGRTAYISSEVEDQPSQAVSTTWHEIHTQLLPPGTRVGAPVIYSVIEGDVLCWDRGKVIIGVYDNGRGNYELMAPMDFWVVSAWDVAAAILSWHLGLEDSCEPIQSDDLIAIEFCDDEYIFMYRNWRILCFGNWVQVFHSGKEAR